MCGHTYTYTQTQYDNEIDRVHYHNVDRVGRLRRDRLRIIIQYWSCLYCTIYGNNREEKRVSKVRPRCLPKNGKNVSPWSLPTAKYRRLLRSSPAIRTEAFWMQQTPTLRPSHPITVHCNLRACQETQSEHNLMLSWTRIEYDAYLSVSASHFQQEISRWRCSSEK